jgi:hypothetical protein
MDRDHEFFALDFTRQDVRGRMVWINSRGSDLYRIAGGVKEALQYTLEGPGTLADIDAAILKVESYMAFLRARIVAVKEMQASPVPSRRNDRTARP